MQHTGTQKVEGYSGEREKHQGNPDIRTQYLQPAMRARIPLSGTIVPANACRVSFLYAPIAVR